MSRKEEILAILQAYPEGLIYGEIYKKCSLCHGNLTRELRKLVNENKIEKKRIEARREQVGAYFIKHRKTTLYIAI